MTEDTRTITPDEYELVMETFHELAEILVQAGIVELTISKRAQLITWDTENKGQVRPRQLADFCQLVDSHYWRLMEAQARPPGSEPPRRRRILRHP